VHVCPACDVPHHAECWNENGGCTTYGCPESPERRASADTADFPEPTYTAPRRTSYSPPPEPWSSRSYGGYDYAKPSVPGCLRILAYLMVIFLPWVGPVIGIIVGAVLMSARNPSDRAFGGNLVFVSVGILVLSCVCAVLSGL